MKLAAWLAKNNLTPTEFARRTDLSQPTVFRYINGDRIPLPQMMEIITKATKGEVQPNDFYPPIPKRAAR